MSELPTSPCPVCGYLTEAATAIGDDDATPSPGDFSLCLNCASVLVYDEVLQLAHPSHQQLQEAPDILWRAQQEVRKVAKVEPQYERLPCGCMAGSEDVGGVRAFVFIPHAMDCQWFAYVQDEMARSGKPVTVIDAR